MTTPLPRRNPTTDRSVTSIPESQWTPRQRQYADLHGLSGATPVAPRRSMPAGGVAEGSNGAYYDTSASMAVSRGADAVARGALAEGTAGAYYDTAESRAISAAADAAANGETAATAAAEAEDPIARANREAKERANRDSFARLKAVLDDYGLGSLSGTIQGWLQDGLSEAEITQRLRETTEFKTRFPAIEERKRKGLSPLSPAEYVAYERQAQQLFRAAGLPQGFYDSREDFTKYLNADVSLSELGDRVGLASRAAFSSDSSVLTALASFGITGGDLTAFFLDPDVAQPLLERKYNAARLSATGNRAGFGYLSETESNDLLSAGVTEGQATQGLSELAGRQELFGQMDRGEDTIGRDEQLDATFRGNANARRRIEQRQRRRQAIFEQGGSFASGQEGITGLGSVRS